MWREITAIVREQKRQQNHRGALPPTYDSLLTLVNFQGQWRLFLWVLPPLGGLYHEGQLFTEMRMYLGHVGWGVHVHARGPL